MKGAFAPLAQKGEKRERKKEEERVREREGRRGRRREEGELAAAGRVRRRTF